MVRRDRPHLGLGGDLRRAGPLGHPTTTTIGISADSGVTEGGAASFTLSANPVPASPLTVKIAVSQSGSGYTVASTSSATVIVSDNDATPPTCLTTDQDLLKQVGDKTDRHKTSGRDDLKEMFGRSHATMQGSDTYTVQDIKDRTDKQGAGPNELWQKIYTELDRLDTFRNGK